MIVFLHGVPETAAIWRKVQAAIGRESVALSLPGFGCERPAGFGASKDDYVEWLVGELDRLGGDVDLVGHDWGAGLTYRVATAHGDRLRSWVADVGNILHPDYEWHSFARIWQTPGEGEEFVAAQAATSGEDGAAAFEAMGVPADDARELAGGSDQTMGDCILALYRSAVPNVHADWGPLTTTSAPGMVVHLTDDPFDDDARAREVAGMLDARFETLAGVGHFWPYQAPDAAAALLTDFWDSLDA